jgi:hypothetical protein
MTDLLRVRLEGTHRLASLHLREKTVVTGHIVPLPAYIPETASQQLSSSLGSS